MIDGSNFLKYNGKFCKETSLQLKATLMGALGPVSGLSTAFTAEVRIDCTPHIVVPQIEQVY